MKKKMTYPQNFAKKEKELLLREESTVLGLLKKIKY
jgi:hypothetical protein